MVVYCEAPANWNLNEERATFASRPPSLYPFTNADADAEANAKPNCGGADSNPGVADSNSSSNSAGGNSAAGSWSRTSASGWSKTRTPYFRHADNGGLYPKQVTTPLMFSDCGSLKELQAAEQARDKTYEETLTRQPTDWMFPAAMRQSNSNHPVEDRGVFATLSYAGNFVAGTEPAINSGGAQDCGSTQTSDGSQDYSGAQTCDDAQDPSSVSGRKAELIDGEQSGRQWMMAAVIDGHSGWQTSEYVAKNLAKFVDSGLRRVRGVLTADRLRDVLTDSFLSLDESLRQKVIGAVELGHSLAGKPGATTACCLLNGEYVVMANVGDSRAYLCRAGRPVALNACHNAGDPVESARLKADHPHDPDIIRCHEPAPQNTRVVRDPPPNWLLKLATVTGIHDYSQPRPPTPACYVKGRLQLTRAFGDFYLKDAKFANDWTRRKLMVGLPHSFPYITARPEITILKQDYAADEFIIIASDGVWDELTPEEACAIASNHNSPAAAATAIQRAVIERVAWKHYKTKRDITSMTPKQRRAHIDDITCIVIDLKPQ
ncbi:putative protein phosphatase 2C [Gregarina niphandrodes]|uniref:PPM-type phosphatase domain-containing protein n=1 Tax=Gregarina niphandrodes TaxID=110365 RepID=A0A023B1H5_GRENI|nr:putative protein phosphatase 2C [Gregarina niphandrodes]EZG47655.1 putative protein phosphatase 2C [Gregarina niphandrodes]|eukprot:XP_011132157.1 putative protein phosphatase 2C [Gregarina niphandrodes]